MKIWKKRMFWFIPQGHTFRLSRRAAQLSFILGASAVLWFLAGSGFARANTAEAIAEAFRTGLSSFHLPTDIHLFTSRRQLIQIYEQNAYQPYWWEEGKPSIRASIVREYLEQAGIEGLFPERYRVAEIGALWNAADPSSQARLDVLLTAAILTYIHDLRYGHLRPGIEEPQLYPQAGNRGFPFLMAFEDLINAPDPGSYLSTLAPQHHFYQKLKLGLERYRKIRDQGGWPIVPTGETIRPGDYDERVVLVRQRLLVEGDIAIDRADADEMLYDDNLVLAIRHFQQRYGLEQDGVIGPMTYEALQVSIDEAIAKIIANLTRWRWQQHHLGEKFVMVNIAHFDLIAVKNDELIHRLAVVVGEDRHKTPVFNDQIRYAELNPYWTVPPGIAEKEELPALRKEADYLVKKHIRLYSGWEEDAFEIDSTQVNWQQVSGRQMRRYMLRQDPGPWNALGSIKFVFPNHYDVYLHDTPQRALFTKAIRNFSHGCIRVSSPEKLAAFLLEGALPEWNEERITVEMAQQRNRIISLPVKVPIYLTYQTAWADWSGRVNFNGDVYNRDDELVRLLYN